MYMHVKMFKYGLMVYARESDGFNCIFIVFNFPLKCYRRGYLTMTTRYPRSLSFSLIEVFNYKCKQDIFFAPISTLEFSRHKLDSYLLWSETLYTAIASANMIIC